MQMKNFHFAVVALLLFSSLAYALEFEYPTANAHWYVGNQSTTLQENTFQLSVSEQFLASHAASDRFTVALVSTKWYRLFPLAELSVTLNDLLSGPLRFPLKDPAYESHKVLLKIYDQSGMFGHNSVLAVSETFRIFNVGIQLRLPPGADIVQSVEIRVEEDEALQNVVLDVTLKRDLLPGRKLQLTLLDRRTRRMVGSGAMLVGTSETLSGTVSTINVAREPLVGSFVAEVRYRVPSRLYVKYLVYRSEPTIRGHSVSASGIALIEQAVDWSAIFKAKYRQLHPSIKQPIKYFRGTIPRSILSKPLAVRNLLYSLLTETSHKVYSLNSYNKQFHLTVYFWGFYIRIRSDAALDKTQCVSNLEQLATMTRAQLNALRATFFRAEYIGRRQDIMAVAALTEAYMPAIAKSLCSKITTDGRADFHFASLWQSPNVPRRLPAIPAAVIDEQETPIDSAKIRSPETYFWDMEIGAQIAKAAYVVYDGEREREIASRFDHLSALFPDLVGSSNFTVILKIDGHNRVHYVMGYSADAIIVGFPGSSKLHDWRLNLDFSQKAHPEIGRVHSGFRAGYDSISAEIQQELTGILRILVENGKRLNAFYVAGHSLGGALASHLALDLYQTIVPRLLRSYEGKMLFEDLDYFRSIFKGFSLGQPQAGNQNFRNTFKNTGLRFRTFYSEFDFMIHLLPLSDTVFKRIILDGLGHARRVGCSAPSNKWVHAGQTLTTEDLSYPPTINPKSFCYYLKKSVIKEIFLYHDIKRYAGIINELALLDPAQGHLKKRLETAQGFRLFSYETGAYCVLPMTQQIENGQPLRCEGTKSEASMNKLSLRPLKYESRRLFGWAQFQFDLEQFHWIKYTTPVAIFAANSGPWILNSDAKRLQFFTKSVVKIDNMPTIPEGESTAQISSHDAWMIKPYVTVDLDDDGIVLARNNTEVSEYTLDIVLHSMSKDRNVCAGNGAAGDDQCQLNFGKITRNSSRFRIELDA